MTQRRDSGIYMFRFPEFALSENSTDGFFACVDETGNVDIDFFALVVHEF